MDIEDAFTERLDACEHQHMYVCDGAKAVTNHYPDDRHKPSRTYIVRRIKLSFGSEGGTGHVFTCQCRDFKYRRLPKATEDAPEGETPPDPLDVPPCELSGVLWAMDDCKHTYAARRDPKPWR